ncbi:hypothetical protein H4219_002531 [Mycoemilia scoparia]|uniref:Uncharacterized protein n=1 Tax=Mycoemilia scoparia TaxID=417184 RepID=A0A9W8A6R2_9FUNG|nr:hypothetical protein H4219_002531 [Mycoemilia scoparia]
MRIHGGVQLLSAFIIVYLLGLTTSGSKHGVSGQINHEKRQVVAPQVGAGGAAAGGGAVAGGAGAAAGPPAVAANPAPTTTPVGADGQAGNAGPAVAANTDTATKATKTPTAALAGPGATTTPTAATTTPPAGAVANPQPTTTKGTTTTGTTTTPPPKQGDGLGGGNGSPETTSNTSSMISTATSAGGENLEYSDCNDFLKKCSDLCKPYSMFQANCLNGGVCLCDRSKPIGKITSKSSAKPGDNDGLGASTRPELIKSLAVVAVLVVQIFA